MTGQGFTLFDTAIGRCGIAWGERGVVGVQLPEARELATRARLQSRFPNAAEGTPPPAVQQALADIVALLGGYALGILEQLVVGYVDPQYSLTIALIVMLVLIGWRSRAEIAGASHDAHAAIQRARVPWPAPVRISLILAGAVFACWLPYQLSTFDVALYDRMGLYALVTIGSATRRL